MGYAVVVTFRVDPANMADFMPLMLANAAASREQEPGCRQFDVAVDADRVGEVFLYEVYDDAAAFEAHKQTDHFTDFAAAAMPMIKETNIRMFREVHG